MKTKAKAAPRRSGDRALPLFSLSLLALVGSTELGLSGYVSAWSSGFLVGVVSVAVLAAAALLSEGGR